MKRRLYIVLASLVLLGVTQGLGKLFPELEPYLPSVERFLAHFDENQGPGAHASKAQEGSALNKAAQETVILALSWTAAFCETRPDKRECKSQTKTRYDAQNFALHGLWPGPSYCSETPYERVPEDLWFAMQRAMPGVQSGLHKHEWEKHGTCYSREPVRYFNDAIRLTLAFNQTPIQKLFVDHMGEHLSGEAIRAAFDEVFGEGAGARVRVHCARDGNRQLVQELRIALKGDLQTANFPRLLKQADRQKPGCAGGVIDAVGLQ